MSFSFFLRIKVLWHFPCNCWYHLVYGVFKIGENSISPLFLYEIFPIVFVFIPILSFHILRRSKRRKIQRNFKFAMRNRKQKIVLLHIIVFAYDFYCSFHSTYFHFPITILVVCGSFSFFVEIFLENERVEG